MMIDESHDNEGSFEGNIGKTSIVVDSEMVDEEVAFHR